MSIEKFLVTPEGALKIREKLNNLTLEDKKKPSYEKISEATNKALIGFGLKSPRKKKGASNFSLEKKLECLDELQRLIPNRFDLENPKPLQIGIDKILFDKLTDRLSKTRIRASLSVFCARREYLINILKDKKRYDLNGDYDSDITEEQIKTAKDDLIKRFGLKTYKKVIRLKD